MTGPLARATRLATPVRTLATKAPPPQTVLALVAHPEPSQRVQTKTLALPGTRATLVSTSRRMVPQLAIAPARLYQRTPTTHTR